MQRDIVIVRTPETRQKVLARIARLSLESPVSITIEPYKRSRSLEQNALYHLWVGIVAKETGNDHDDIHEHCRQSFLPPRIVEVNGEIRETRRSTASLKVDEMAEYMDKVYAWATGELGIKLPLPEDRYTPQAEAAE